MGCEKRDSPSNARVPTQDVSSHQRGTIDRNKVILPRYLKAVAGAEEDIRLSAPQSAGEVAELAINDGLSRSKPSRTSKPSFLNAAAISGGQNVNSLIYISLTLGERLADHQAQVI